jgi:hypothetical protein
MSFVSAGSSNPVIRECYHSTVAICKLVHQTLARRECSLLMVKVILAKINLTSVFKILAFFYFNILQCFSSLMYVLLYVLFTRYFRVQ